MLSNLARHWQQLAEDAKRYESQEEANSEQSALGALHFTSMAFSTNGRNADARYLTPSRKCKMWTLRLLIEAG